MCFIEKKSFHVSKIKRINKIHFREKLDKECNQGTGVCKKNRKKKG